MLEIIETNPKTILNRYEVVDSWFQCRYSMNIYRGCQHGCAYCDGRSGKYWPKGGNELFDKRVEVKINAPALLAKSLQQIRDRGEPKEVISVGGGVTDVYQPLEKKYELTRKCLQAILNNRFPAHILTKSDLVLRDIDLIKKIAEKSYCAVTFSFSTTNDELGKALEPCSSYPSQRLAAMKELNRQGITTGACLMPIVPFITDSDEMLDTSIKNLSDNGAGYVMCSPMTLADLQQKYFMGFIEKNYSFFEKYIGEGFQQFKERYDYLYRYGYAPDKEYTKRLGERTQALLRNHGVRPKMPKFKVEKKDEEQKQLRLV